MGRPMRPLDKTTQAGRIITKFGGITKCWQAMQRVECDRQAIPQDSNVLYRWTYPVSKRGTGGLIPAPAVHVILLAAKLAGIELTAEDWFPNTTQGD